MARGGKREGAGRRVGSPNKLTLEEKRTLSEIARDHTASAVNTLVSIMGSTKAPAAARVSAATNLLERGWGKPVAHIEHTGANGGPIQHAEVSALDVIESRIASIRERGRAVAPDSAKPH